MPSETPVGLTSADRIRELNAIDADIARVLSLASSGIRTLAGAQPSPADGVVVNADAGDPSNVFRSQTRDLFQTIQSVSARLRRQVYALEEARLIASTTPDVGARSAAERGQNVLNGGLGNLDVGWLNSRRNGIGKRKEAELWETAKGCVLGMADGAAAKEEGEEIEMDQG